jgi:hypothetical protein
VLTDRTLDQIAGDEGSAEWRSRPAGRGKLKAAWLADAVAKLDERKKAERNAATKTGKNAEKETGKKRAQGQRSVGAVTAKEKKTKKPLQKSA